MAKLGLFGGTFNPIHVGHLMIAEEARLAAGLDRVVFIPSGDSYLKDPSVIASREDRLAMTRLAVADAPEGFEVSDTETRREGPSYTSETLTAFHDRYPGDALFLILGADSLLELERWRSPETILRLATVLAFTRGGQDEAALRDAAAALERRYGARIRLLSAFSLSVSSSEIRAFAREGHAFWPLVTPRVYRYIQDHGLYVAAD